MDISTFDDILQAARQQVEPQRLLLVFAGASLPQGASAAQRARFEAGESGELASLMCVDKDPNTLADFKALVAEAAALGPPWARRGRWFSPAPCRVRAASRRSRAWSTPPCSAWWTMCATAS